MLSRQNLQALLWDEEWQNKCVEFILFGAILISAVVIALDSIEEVSQKYGIILLTVEFLLTVFFGVEYALRLWSAPNRIRYVFSFWGIIDLLSVLPVFFILMGAANPTKVLRLLKLARLLKLIKLGGAHARLIEAFRNIREEILTFLILAFVAVFLSAVGIYYFENSAQPEVFGSIPESMWWAVVTLTTVGYGDAYPVTLGGKIFTGALLMIGLAIVAVPTGLFSTALLQAKKDKSGKVNKDE